MRALLPVALEAETPPIVNEECGAARDIDLLADFADDEDASVVNPIAPAKGALIGILVGIAFWASVLTLIIRR